MARVALALLLLAGAPAQQKPLPDQIDALVRSLELKDAKVGVLVHSVKAGAAVYAHRERQPLLLASNTKLLTTSAALGRLGPGFTFRTAVGTIGRDLHVFAGGDPNISGRFHEGDPAAIFKKWAAQLRAAGLARVDNLVLHTGIFDGEHVNPGWKGYEPWHWWSAPFGALSLNDNCVDVKIAPGAEGEPARVILSPDTACVTLVNECKTTGKGARPFTLRRAPGTNTITLRGEIAARSGSGTWWVSVHDPTAYFGEVLRETLRSSGIEVEGKVVESDALLEDCRDFKELAAWESGLAPTLAACNQPSQNFYAEMILRTLGWKVKGRGTLANGLAAAAEFHKTAGLEGVSQADGSGLTRENLASPSDLVRLLLHMRGHAHAREFLDSFPAAGQAKTTLRSRFLAADLKGRIRAKTGHIAGVASLSGYAESVSGDTYVFSILVNADPGVSSAPADRLQDRIVELLVRHKGE